MASPAEQFADKGFQPFPQGLKPGERQELTVGALRPCRRQALRINYSSDPLKTGFFRKL